MQTEKIEVTVSKRIVIEAVDGGLYFISELDAEGNQSNKKAAMSSASLLKHVTSTLSLEKAKRGPRKAKAEAATAAAPAATKPANGGKK